MTSQQLMGAIQKYKKQIEVQSSIIKQQKEALILLDEEQAQLDEAINQLLDNIGLNHQTLVKVKKQGLTNEPALMKRLSALILNNQEHIRVANQYVGNEMGSTLNKESFLKQHGYDTTLTRGKRWDILRNVIIPKYGVVQTAHMIEFNIRLRSNTPENEKKFENALSAWRMDLKMIYEM